MLDQCKTKIKDELECEIKHENADIAIITETRSSKSQESNYSKLTVTIL